MEKPKTRERSGSKLTALFKSTLALTLMGGFLIIAAIEASFLSVSRPCSRQMSSYGPQYDQDDEGDPLCALDSLHRRQGPHPPNDDDASLPFVSNPHAQPLDRLLRNGDIGFPCASRDSHVADVRVRGRVQEAALIPLRQHLHAVESRASRPSCWGAGPWRGQS